MQNVDLEVNLLSHKEAQHFQRFAIPRMALRLATQPSHRGQLP